ncbi:MAG: histidine phosphatase family protein, partial [Candidatus Omnitrophota bacterium]
MNDILRYPEPFICLVRHGETELSVARRYNGLGDIALTTNGEGQARSIAASLNNVDWESVLASPLKRARRTAELAGFANPEIVEGLREFDYGECEGKTTSEVLEKHPGWDFWQHGCPGGETLKKAGRRLDGVIEKLHSYKG